MLFLKAESDLASLIYDTQTDLHQKKLKRSHQQWEQIYQRIGKN